MDDLDIMKELKAQGFVCSQIILKMGLELQGKENPDLIKSVQGLAGGLGFMGDVCGALSGGCCLLGLYAGKGTLNDQDDPRMLFMVEDLVNWFTEKFGSLYGGIHCLDIINNEGQKMAVRCPQITADTYQKIKELLVENNFDLSGIA